MRKPATIADTEEADNKRKMPQNQRWSSKSPLLHEYLDHFHLDRTCWHTAKVRDLILSWRAAAHADQTRTIYIECKLSSVWNRNGIETACERDTAPLRFWHSTEITQSIHSVATEFGQNTYIDNKELRQSLKKSLFRYFRGLVESFRRAYEEFKQGTCRACTESRQS